MSFLLVAEMGFDGLCPSFATRTPDYVRLRRGGSNPTNLSLYIKKEKTPNWMSFLLVAEMGFDGLCPSFATRTPDYVRLRRGGSNPTNLSLYIKKEKTPNWMSFLLVAEMGFEPHDLRVMSPTSYQAALLRDIYCSRLSA